MKTTSLTSACLSGLIILQLVMLSAMLTQIEPHPPFTTPLFAMGPFLGLAIALAFCSILLGSEHTKLGRSLSVLAVVAALISFGPQKWFDPLFHQIWPAVIGAQICVITIVYRVFTHQKTALSAA